MTESQRLASAIRGAVELLPRYLAGFDDANAIAQPSHLPNHLIWSLGHLALTMHRAAEKIADRTIALDWDPEPFAFDSSPSARAGDYPPLAEMMARYRRAHEQLAEVVEQCGEADLDRQVVWGGGVKLTCRDVAIRMMFHNGTHCGQIVDLRRALGMPRVIVMTPQTTRPPQQGPEPGRR